MLSGRQTDSQCLTVTGEHLTRRVSKRAGQDIYVSSKTVFRMIWNVLQIADRIRAKNGSVFQCSNVFNQAFPIAFFYMRASLYVRLQFFSTFVDYTILGVYIDRLIRKII